MATAIPDAGEQCDDGNLVNGDSCESDCTLPRCGNGILDAGEQCDDGNLVAGDGCSASCQREGQDTTPPVIRSVSAKPNGLWPPNHKMTKVTLTARVTDDHDPAPVCRIVGVRSNEPTEGLGDGDSAPDWMVTGSLTLLLRAERAGGGNGRLYTMDVACGDASKNTSIANVTVSVPHDQGKK